MAGVTAPYSLVQAGTEVWHVYNEHYSPSAFNPNSRNRFAGHLAEPVRSMFYAGATPDCAMWETTLRNVVPEAHFPHPSQPQQSVHGVVVPPAKDRGLARLRLQRDVSVLDLRPLGARVIAGDNHRLRDRLSMLTVVPKYTETHKEAARLLADFPKADGLMWSSKQMGEDAAYVFYEPPMASTAFEVVETTSLGSRRGVSFIDQALARAKMCRMDVDALAEEIEAEFPEERGEAE